MVHTEIAAGDQGKFSQVERIAVFAVGFEERCFLGAERTRRRLRVQADFKIGKQIEYNVIVLVSGAELLQKREGFFFLANHTSARAVESFSRGFEGKISERYV